MSEDLLIRHCSPTLAGIKTGNLFSCACPSRKDLTKDLCRLNKKLVPKGIRVLPLRVRKGRALIYAYRPNALESDLTDHRARALLLKYGYVPENPNGCVVHLIHRLRSEGEFPHEIGLFLSYPPEDVLGFICNRACNHKCVGCWKVYGDEQAARSIFEKYEMCSKIYSRQWQQGKSIEGNTEAMAMAVAEGAKGKGAEVSVITAAEFSPEQVSEYSAIAFGCPSMGSEQLEESEFEPMFTACEGRLSGKNIALFGSYGWGDGEWMRSWESRCNDDGANLACDSVICNEAPDDDALAACRELGASLV